MFFWNDVSWSGGIAAARANESLDEVETSGGKDSEDVSEDVCQAKLEPWHFLP